MENSKSVPELSKNVVIDNATFSFKYLLPGDYKPSKPNNPSNRYKLALLKEIPPQLPKEYDTYQLCLLPKPEYEKVYNKLSHPYYLVIGLSTFKARLCTIIYTNERHPLASPSIINFFKEEEVTIEHYTNFIYRPIPYALKVTISPIIFMETDSYPVNNKLKCEIRDKQIILPGDIMCNTKEVILKWSGEFLNVGMWKIISIEYKGLHNKRVTAYDINSQPGFFLTKETEVIQISNKTHDHIDYDDIKYRSQCNETPSDWESIECIDNTVEDILNFYKEQCEMKRRLIRIIARGNQNLEVVINLLARKLSLKVCKRNLTYCLTTNDLIEKLAKGLSQIAPALVWIKNIHEVKTILAAIYESQKIPEKQLQNELLTSLKSLYLELEKNLHEEVIIIYTTNTSEEILLDVNDYEVTLGPLTKVNKEYLVDEYCKYWKDPKVTLSREEFDFIIE